MRGRNKPKSVGIDPPDCFNFKSSENINERHVFEKLCLDTSLRGFSYDPSLLVDLNKVSSFDEACIRLTTKCGSIVTQLCSVGHNVTDFAVTSAITAKGTITSPKTPTVPKIVESPVSLFNSHMSPSSLYFLDSQTSPLLSPTSLAKPKFHGFDCMKNDTLTPQDNRNISVMGQLWGGLKKKNYTGMVAVARVTSTSLPNNNSSKDHYSIKALTDTLLSNIKGYFMFQNFSSTFNKDFENSSAHNVGKNNNSEPGGEYLLYVVYRSKAADKDTKKTSLKQRGTEADKLSSPWSAYVSGSSRKLRHESGDSAVSSCSSISSTTSGGPSSFFVPSGKTSTIRPENPQDKFTNPQSYSTPQILRSPPASQTRKLITPPSPPSQTTPKVPPLQGAQGQKIFSPKSQVQSFSKSSTFSLRNLRNHPYKQQEANSSSNIESYDTVSKAINVAISSLSPKTQPQNIFTNQVKQQQKSPIKKQTLPQIDKKQYQPNKTTLQMQRQQPTRHQQQKSQETTAKASIVSLTEKNSSTAKRVPITAPKPEGPTKNLRSHSSTISSLPKILRSSPAIPADPATPVAPVAPVAPGTPAAPAAISQRNLRHSFTKK